MTAQIVVASAVVLLLYTYLGYPALVWVLAAWRPRPEAGEPEDWPAISFSVPAYNEEHEIGELLDNLLGADYPEDRRQIVVVSDASTDRTDEIVRSYADRGVELIRLGERSGKTAAEAAAAERLTGEIVVNTDASIRISPGSVKALVAQFQDPRVGAASSRDVSISRGEAEAGAGEGGYVGYEMWVRSLETRLYGIIGASGSYYAIRRRLHSLPLPAALSRDFAAALHCEEHGFRAVSVQEAICYVPRTESIQREYRRKVRTITRGMRTLWQKRKLLNPVRHPTFAFMLFSHKILRWMLPWLAIVAFAALVALAPAHLWAQVLVAVGGAGAVLGALGWWLEARGHSVPRLLTFGAFGLMSNAAAARAFLGLITGQRQAIWEPTRR